MGRVVSDLGFEARAFDDVAKRYPRDFVKLVESKISSELNAKSAVLRRNVKDFLERFGKDSGLGDLRKKGASDYALRLDELVSGYREIIADRERRDGHPKFGQLAQTVLYSVRPECSLSPGSASDFTTSAASDVRVRPYVSWSRSMKLEDGIVLRLRLLECLLASMVPSWYSAHSRNIY